jgi:ribosomal protein S18 acetylase RimI-like enzyme
MGQAVIQIRDATPGDVPEIARVYKEAWRFTYQGIIPHLHLEAIIAHRGTDWWVKRCDGGLIVGTFNDVPQGYAVLGRAVSAPVPDAGEIFELYVAPTFIGIGLGQRMFLAARESLQKDGCRGLIVWALADNEAACAFYSHLGGACIASRPEHFGNVTLTRLGFYWPHEVR